MTNRLLRLRHADMVRALDQIDLLAVISHNLTRRPAADQPGVTAASDLTTVEDHEHDRTCQLPTPSLKMISRAGLAGLAARELLPPGVVTAAVFGSGAAAQLQLEVIARYLPNVSHAAANPAMQTEHTTEWNVFDQLEQAGITLSIQSDPRRAALGANLLIIAELGWDRLDVGHLHPGVLVVNATRRDLPDTLLAQVDRLYVDDITQLEHNQHRTFVRLHLNEPDTRSDPSPPRYRDGWYRRQPLWRHRRRIDADLGHILAGEHRPADVDDILLVEFLDSATLDTHLATHICRAAITLGLGQQS